jgi:acyl-CoA hydrolase
MAADDLLRESVERLCHGAKAKDQRPRRLRTPARRYDRRSMDPRPASESRSVLVRLVCIGDANSAGFVHGGVVMKLCDDVAGIAAIRHCRGRVVTAAMDRMTFIQPVNVGELLTCSATVNAAWRTSMEVGVRVEAENPRTGERRHTSTAYLTMVALDDEGRPVPVPPLLAESDDERRRQREAELRRANRLAERDQILTHRD